MNKTYPIKSIKNVKKLKNYYLEKGSYRNYLLITFCLNTALRISDVISIEWSDILDENGRIKRHIVLKEKKTGKESIIYINKNICSAIRLFLKNCDRGRYVFESRQGGHLSRSQAHRIIQAGGRGCGIGSIGCHSLRKTFGYHAWKNGTPPAVLMDIYNHSSYAVTKRYLGISQDDRDHVFKMNVL